jgi:hypothetical protein
MIASKKSGDGQSEKCSLLCCSDSEGEGGGLGDNSFGTCTTNQLATTP